MRAEVNLEIIDVSTGATDVADELILVGLRRRKAVGLDAVGVLDVISFVIEKRLRLKVFIFVGFS